MQGFKRLFFLFPLPLFGLERTPWFCQQWEMTFTPSYTYSRYPNVQKGTPHFRHPSNDHLVSLDLTVPPSPDWELNLEAEFVDTPRESMGFRSVAFQTRYLWLDDFLGDGISLTTGGVIRGVSQRSLRDVSTPYHSTLNFEANLAIGREWDPGEGWGFRAFGGTSIGIANRGSPWLSFFAVTEGQKDETHRLAIFLEGAAGFGRKKTVHINHFHGYAFLKHRNLDIGLKYTYLFEIWGRLSFAYTHRLYARSFPERVNFFTVSYMLPFSVF